MKKAKITAKAVQKLRYAWYEFHFGNRARVQALSDEERMKYQRVVSMIGNSPQMSVFGGSVFDHLDAEIYRIAEQQGLDAILLNPWYMSCDGWQAFNELWQQLPEPVDLLEEKVVQFLSTAPCGENAELSTLSTVPPDAGPPSRSTLPR